MLWTTFSMPESPTHGPKYPGIARRWDSGKWRELGGYWTKPPPSYFFVITQPISVYDSLRTSVFLGLSVGTPNRYDEKYIKVVQGTMYISGGFSLLQYYG